MIKIGKISRQVMNRQTKQEHQPSLESENWPVTKLLKLPDNYHLNRSSFEVSGQDVRVITSRISACNMIRSVHAIYDNNMAMAKCKTPSYIKFNIRLFQAPGYPGNMIIEVRRMCGCSLAFREEYRAIYQAAKYGEVHRHKKILPLMDVCTKETYAPVSEEIIERNLEMSQNHLRSTYYDAQALVLQDLASATAQSSTETAFKVSRLILQKYTGILDVIVNVIAQTAVTHDDDGDDDYDDERLRNGALILLRNILTTLLGDSDDGSGGSEVLESVSRITSALSEKTLVQILLEDVKAARKYPSNACLAVECLVVLAEKCMDTRLHIKSDKNVLNTLEDARVFGIASYSNLKDIVEKLMRS